MLRAFSHAACLWHARPSFSPQNPCLSRYITYQHRRSIKTCKLQLQASMAPHAPATEPVPMHVYHMGQGTLRIDREKLHGKIRSNFVTALKAELSKHGSAPDAGVALFQGGGPFHVYSTDGELIFKQESYMHYLFGVTEDSWYGAVDISTGRAHLFMPRLPESYAVWMGKLKQPADYQQIYAVHAVHYVDELPSVLSKLLDSQGNQQSPVYVLEGTNSDSGIKVPAAQFDGMNNFNIQHSSLLFNVLTECRVRKTSEEIAILRYANQIGGAGHVAMMQASKPGLMEYQLESLFLHTCYSQGGCRLTGYTPISASGPNGAVLHYGHAGAPNDRQMVSGDMMLVDMGCEYYRYGSDITCSWPVNGKFTQAQKVVYNAVLKAHEAVIDAMRPGVSWPDLHTLAYRTILTDLKAGGLVTGDVEGMLKADIGALFMPHGLGHFLGVDTHDVGGYLPGSPDRIHRPGYKSLRTARKLEPGMVITVEPGCYFTEALLLPAFEDPNKANYLVKDEIMKYIYFGGVRIEDNVVVTEHGAESLTHVPRTVQDIEAVMAGSSWPPNKE